MSEARLQISSSSTLDAIRERPSSLRRARPPDIDVSQHGDGVPLRAERSAKRESKIGLKGLFTRTKPGKTDKDADEPSPRTASRHAGIRASLVDFSNWPYRHSSRSEASLTSAASADPPSAPADRFGLHRPRQVNPSGVMNAPWTPPPFFQVYPQAVKHATLPYCNVSVDTLARHSESRSSKFIQEVGIVNSEKAKGDVLKKPRIGLRTSWEWTSKIFVLITSGYLLQYAAEGTFNRMPEKILQITATSAAYASDLIPGRHWVLQVASNTDENGNTVTDGKSRRSKLSIKDNGRVSNMLLVFESAESMDSWLAVLRREIELRGGKRKLSETGDVEMEDPTSAGTKEQPSQQPMAVKDRIRFPGAIVRDFSYTQENALIDPMENDFPISPRRFSAYTIDNNSSTASMISSDGLRLDNLRDSSSSSHRFSYVSSGQRTMMTSEGSSPACSPTRVSFSSQGEDSQPLPNAPEVRLRPNAAAIVNRRQSMQALIISSFEAAPTEPNSRLYANPASMSGHENEQPHALSVPNFSVPNTVNKRFSLNTTAPNGVNHLPQIADYERGSKLARKMPPTALLMSRPLSIVIDQPSPRSPCSPNSLSRSVDSSQSTPFEFHSAGPDSSTDQNASGQTWPPRRSSQILHSQAGDMNEFAGAANRPAPGPGAEDTLGPGEARKDDGIQRATPSTEPHGYRRRFSGKLPSKDSFNERSSLLGESRSFQNEPLSPGTSDEWKSIAVGQASLGVPLLCSPKRSAPSLRAPLPITSPEKLITGRRSMPHLEGVPPPAPPPMCALPPIPQQP
ncbi:putative peptidase family M20 M25 M40 protein [Rosellinia necatrix]|uniref:Putative peptidase family M20 M25 M40 protein n=1 Tax=Rosellinia necatrix TaxID=77044 RepID=A0A1S7UJP5_ROSNE|nr:putative peptidase family M20 M25 M40 protein [Rosellinia necatrix]